MLKASDLVRPLKDQIVQCRVCEHFCVLKPGAWGKCGVRVNRDGIIYSTVYGEAVAVHVDPIEKKPLYHFLPGSQALSVGTYGCNMHCRWCQNWQLSQVRQHQGGDRYGEMFTPSELVEIAQRRGLASIAYTYNEPTVFFEYSYDTAMIARERGIKNVYVSNGYMSQESLDRLAPYLDGINVDLKGFTEDLYRTYTGARLEPVKRTIAYIARETDIWIEVTTLVIPNLNDSDEELRDLASWLSGIDPRIPWHVSAFYPTFEMLDRPRTPPATLERAYDIGKEAGLEFVYVGNIMNSERESTYCPICGMLVIERSGYQTRVRGTETGRCPGCGAVLAGVWR
ncbi:MAG: AmmeMemoRadiSam system radical SAM enzyme [Anaerolineae bacterium]|nr:AmmeMemoRadiSam system radical SAM enzyme [Anaerolineae bacterium]